MNPQISFPEVLDGEMYDLSERIMQIAFIQFSMPIAIRGELKNADINKDIG